MKLQNTRCFKSWCKLGWNDLVNNGHNKRAEIELVTIDNQDAGGAELDENDHKLW